LQDLASCEFSLHGQNANKESTASRVEKHRFFTLKAVLFHPQSGAFPKTPLRGLISYIDIFLTFLHPCVNLCSFFEAPEKDWLKLLEKTETSPPEPTLFDCGG